MSSWVLAGVVMAAVVALIVRRLRGEPLVARELYGTPAILIAIGVYSVAKLDRVTGTDLLWVAVGSVIGVLLGFARGHTVRVFERDGVLWQRYAGSTFAVWAGSLVVNFGVGALAAGFGMHPQARPMTLAIGVGMLGEALAVGRKALATGVPFAPARDRVAAGG